jgi:hypothetical protein
VVGVEPSWKSSGYAQVHELFGQHRYREVLQEGQAALTQADVPRWQQRVLVALMVDSAVSLKQHAVAGRVFKALAAESPPDLLLSRIPIPWSDELIGVTPTVTKEALAWIESDTPAMQLLGASWLTGGEHRLAAIDKLKVLSTNSSSLISSYAKVQLWRVVPPEEILSERFQEWTQQRDALPLPLQAGPTMLLAHRLAQANQSKLAVAEWLRIASMHSDRYHLADQAKQRATELAKKTGDAVFAKKIEAAFAGLSPPAKDPVSKQ